MTTWCSSSRRQTGATLAAAEPFNTSGRWTSRTTWSRFTSPGTSSGTVIYAVKRQRRRTSCQSTDQNFIQRTNAPLTSHCIDSSLSIYTLSKDWKMSGNPFKASVDCTSAGFDPSLVTCYDDLLQYVVRTEGGYQCSCGGFSHRWKMNVQNHLESIHFPGHFVWNCDLCGEQAKTRNGLSQHKSKFHSKKANIDWKIFFA